MALGFQCLSHILYSLFPQFQFQNGDLHAGSLLLLAHVDEIVDGAQIGVLADVLHGKLICLLFNFLHAAFQNAAHSFLADATGCCFAIFAVVVTVYEVAQLVEHHAQKDIGMLKKTGAVSIVGVWKMIL